jgi:hypothetical protein
MSSFAAQTSIQSLGLVGETWDRKACFEARDTYFDCLDDNKLIHRMI